LLWFTKMTTPNFSKRPVQYFFSPLQIGRKENPSGRILYLLKQIQSEPLPLQVLTCRSRQIHLRKFLSGHICSSIPFQGLCPARQLTNMVNISLITVKTTARPPKTIPEQAELHNQISKVTSLVQCTKSQILTRRRQPTRTSSYHRPMIFHTIIQMWTLNPSTTTSLRQTASYHQH